MTAPGIRWRLEVEGRPGWFVPAVEGVFPSSAQRGDIKSRLTRLLRSYYPPEPEDILVLKSQAERLAMKSKSVQRGPQQG
jgi:hypothetical protein